MGPSNLYFIVGSPRSGTKIFRDTLEAHPSVTTTDHPLEEIWTTGQADVKHEEYNPDTITPDIRETVQRAFERKLTNTEFFVEKNVRNSLRIPYIRDIFPDAKFLHIIRDGRDAATSIRKRWQNPIDWNYYLSSRGLQLSLRDIFFYSFRLGGMLLKRIIQGRKHVDIWGPHYPGLTEDLKQRSLLEVSALQWKHCVEAARRDGPVESDSYFELHYETLMTNPREVLDPLRDFMNLSSNEAWVSFAEQNFRPDSMGRWKKDLSDQELQQIEPIICDLLDDLNYPAGHS